MTKKALVVYGGWDGHEPVQISQAYKRLLEEEGFEVEMSDSLEAFADKDNLMQKDIIIPHWTMSTITREQLDSVLSAVASGVGIAGCHGGMCDAFHDSVDWQFMTGGQWVSHPGGQKVRYKVNITNNESEITEGISDFYMVSEQYYMHVDPAVKVLATTEFPVGKGPFAFDGIISLEENSGFGKYNFDEKDADKGPHVSNGPVTMPVAWTKYFGFGRVYYSSLGHICADFEQEPVYEMMRRGILWASK